MADWCDNCAKADYGENGCMIQLRALAHRISEPEYPMEWSFDNFGQAQCTAFTLDEPVEPRCDQTPDLFGEEEISDGQ